MESSKHYYLLELSYLGFRYHGWQRQPQVKTIQSILEKNIKYVLGHKKFRTLAASRTDAGVSADGNMIKLIVNKPISIPQFLSETNQCLPNDILIKTCREVKVTFNVIQTPSIKTYEYSFSNNETTLTSLSPFMVNFNDKLDIARMQEAALLFQGEHFFGRFCQDPSDNTMLTRKIDESEILVKKSHDILQLDQEYYVFRIVGPGFMRYQIRLLMAALLDVGRHNVSLSDIRKALLPGEVNRWSFIAPAHGLRLKQLEIIDLATYLI